MADDDDVEARRAAPDGTLAACCIAWPDAVNRVGSFEPVGKHPAYRRIDLGRAVTMEGINRLAALGACKAWVGSGQPFYGAIGFSKKYLEIVSRRSSDQALRVSPLADMCHFDTSTSAK
jgi:hypothetical protein